jgi:hypothetical protein
MSRPVLALAALLLLALQPALAETFRSRDGDAGRRPRGEETPADSTRLPEADRQAMKPQVSRGGVFLRSLVVPGWGETVVARARPELGAPGRTPFLVDLGLATAVWGFARYGSIKRDEYQAYAGRTAGAGFHGDGSDFWVDISNYASVEAYNTEMLRQGRHYLRYDPATHGWSWPDTASRARYRDLRALSEDAYSRALAVGGAMLVNRLLSGIRAARLAQDSPLELAFLPRADGWSLALSIDLGRPAPSRSLP